MIRRAACVSGPVNRRVLSHRVPAALAHRNERLQSSARSKAVNSDEPILGTLSVGELAGPPQQSFGNTAGPQTIGRFRVERLLGEGGFAQVYLAYDPSLDRQVAIKIPHSAFLRPDFLRREALVAAKLKHSAIVQIYEICPGSSAEAQRDDPAVYIVMQYIEGTNLAKKLETEKVRLDAAVDLMLDIAEAVGFAHSHGVLHRDLKPQNILLDVNGRPYVADFGLAIRQETVHCHLGENCGTPAYMSPEQAQGLSVTPASDIWSLGVILYEILVRQRPYGTHPLEVLSRLATEDPVPPRDLDSTVPQQLERVCLKCLARTPADRYQSAAELVADLRAWKVYRAVGPSEEDLRKAEQSYNQAFSCIDEGDPGSAIDRLQQVVQLNPDSAKAHYLLGLAHLMTDRSVELAVHSLKSAVELNRDNAAAHFVLANIYFAAGAFPLAAACAGQALANRPSSHAYRDFQRKAAEKLAALSSGNSVKSVEIRYDLDPARRRQLSDLSEAVFHDEKSSQLSLAHWTEFHFPWRMIRGRPLLGSVLLSVALYAVVVVLHLSVWDDILLLRLAVPYVIIWMGLYFPFLLARMLERTYIRLLPAVDMPEDAFRRFYIRQSAYILGGTCSLKDAETPSQFQLSWQHNWLHLLIAAACIPPLLALQFLCANEPFWPLTPVRIGLYGSAVLQIYATMWVAPLVAFCVLFIPRFYNIPVRYFLGMPAELSLATVGTFYVRLGWLSCLGYCCFVLQHYLFRTYQTAPLVSVLYMVCIASWIVSIVVVSQYQLHRLLTRLKVRKVLEYSHHVEAAFERAMKRPGKETFESLESHQQFIKKLKGLSTKGLRGEDLLQFLLILACLAGVTYAYWYLVGNNLWLS